MLIIFFDIVVPFLILFLGFLTVFTALYLSIYLLPIGERPDTPLIFTQIFCPFLALNVKFVSALVILFTLALLLLFTKISTIIYRL